MLHLLAFAGYIIFVFFFYHNFFIFGGDYVGAALKAVN